jgi:hypothetical protein
VLAALAVICASLVGYLTHDTTRNEAPFVPPATIPAVPVPGAGVLRYGGDWSAGSPYRPYSYLLVSSSNAAPAAREPGRSLVYFSGTDVNVDWSAGVPYAQALRNGWLLKDDAGALLVNKAYPDNRIGDVGNPAYQRAWARNVLAFLNKHGNDGVFIDDVIRDLQPLAGTEAAKYPTVQAWASAQLSFVASVGAALRRHGYYVLVNASGYIPGNLSSDDGTSTLEWWRQLAPHVSGLLNEYYQETPDGTDTMRSSGPDWNQQWQGWQRLEQVAQAAGKDFVGLSYGPADDRERMMYGKASFLLDWNGRGGAYIYDPSNDAAPNFAWSPDIGRPAAPKQRVGSGWLRRYASGIAVVNPAPSSSQTFDLGGRYVTPEGQVITSVSLPGTSALVLRKAVP